MTNCCHRGHIGPLNSSARSTSTTLCSWTNSTSATGALAYDPAVDLERVSVDRTRPRVSRGEAASDQVIARAQGDPGYHPPAMPADPVPPRRGRRYAPRRCASSATPSNAAAPRRPAARSRHKLVQLCGDRVRCQDTAAANSEGDKRRALVRSANNTLGEPGSGLGQPRTRCTPAGVAWRSDFDSQHMTRRPPLPHTKLFSNPLLLPKTGAGQNRP